MRSKEDTVSVGLKINGNLQKTLPKSFSPIKGKIQKGRTQSQSSFFEMKEE
jgi:hypothetical protein